MCVGGVCSALYLYLVRIPGTQGGWVMVWGCQRYPYSQHFLRRLVRMKHTMATHAAAARERGEGAAAAEGEKRMCA